MEIVRADLSRNHVTAGLRRHAKAHDVPMPHRGKGIADRTRPRANETGAQMPHRATVIGVGMVIHHAKSSVVPMKLRAKPIVPVKVTVPARAARRKDARVPVAQVAADSAPDLARRGLVRAALAEAGLAVDLVGAAAGLAARTLARGAVVGLMPAPNPVRETEIDRRATKVTGRKADASGLVTAMSLASREAKAKRSQPA